MEVFTTPTIQDKLTIFWECCKTRAECVCLEILYTIEFCSLKLQMEAACCSGTRGTSTILYGVTSIFNVCTGVLTVQTWSGVALQATHDRSFHGWCFRSRNGEEWSRSRNVSSRGTREAGFTQQALITGYPILLIGSVQALETSRRGAVNYTAGQSVRSPSYEIEKSSGSKLRCTRPQNVARHVIVDWTAALQQSLRVTWLSDYTWGLGS
jgi:hypothetical protein